MSESIKYCPNLFGYERWKTREVKIGNIGIGGNNPIRVQSMTTTDTMDTQATVEQSIRMIEAGCELVRITAPSIKEAENLRNIKDELVKRGYNTPLVADIHFTPNAAEVAAKIVEKVRVNPGNYADKKKFEVIDYTDETYQAELERIEERFTPLVLLCKEHGTAMRIGTNHGSLSDRILSRYGDTPEGMVESAMEFLRICRKHDYHEIVLSMKASNTLVMVQAYRLLVSTMMQEGMDYPLHLGVTEAGDGEDGRIKSAVGIGALLEDGLGDTVRVSLTEAPEAEAPVAKALIDRYEKRGGASFPSVEYSIHPFAQQKRETPEIANIGGTNVPRVCLDLSKKESLSPASFFGAGYTYSVPLDKWNLSELAADYIYIGKKSIDFEIPGTLGIIQDVEVWERKDRHYPICTISSIPQDWDQLFFLTLDAADLSGVEVLKNHPNAVLILQSSHIHNAPQVRAFVSELQNQGVKNPVISQFNYSISEDDFLLQSATDAGLLLVDGLVDGIFLNADKVGLQRINQTAFGILQAARARISKTEYISCPSCGRTLFDLEQTTAKIRAVTHHLKGVKIGIMGCIVNGPGEMADADYGYVGTGVGKITLYKEKEVVRRNVPEADAVEALIDLIKEHGDWVEYETATVE